MYSAERDCILNCHCRGEGHQRRVAVMSGRKSQALARGSVGWSIIPFAKMLWVQFPVGGHTVGNQLMFLSHFDVYLSLSPSLSNQ